MGSTGRVVHVRKDPYDVPEGAVPEDTKFLVAVVSRDTSDAHLVEGDRTTTVYVEPR